MTTIMKTTTPFPAIKEEDQQSQPEQSTRVRKVSFAGKVRIKKTISRSSYTPEEIEATWFTKAEYKTITHKARRIISKMKNKLPCPYCTRGLEGMVGERSKHKQQYRRCVYRIVLSDGAWIAEEMEINRLNGRELSREEIIAERYHQISVLCQLEACMRGKADAVKSQSMDKGIQSASQSATATAASIMTSPKAARQQLSMQMGKNARQSGLSAQSQPSLSPAVQDKPRLPTARAA